VTPVFRNKIGQVRTYGVNAVAQPDGGTSGVSAAQNIALAIADHPRLRKVDLVFGSRLEE
jgi:hypothetical protein